MLLKNHHLLKVLIVGITFVSSYSFATCDQGSLVHMKIANASSSSMYIQGIGTDTSRIPVTNELELKVNDFVTGDVCFKSVRGASLRNYSGQFALKVADNKDMKYAAEVDYNNIPFQQPTDAHDNDVNPSTINQPFASSVNKDNDCDAAHSQNCTISIRLLGE